MPYAEGRTYHDADSHVMETPDWLAPYADPETGAQLSTTFEGRLDGDTIGGSYTTRGSGTGDTQTGQWKVTRRTR